MHFIFFDELTSNPKEVIDGVYKFLGEPPFKHDFDNVEQTTHEDDFFHGFKDLHTIRKQVLPIPPDWREILGDFAERYASLNFWDKYRRYKK